MKVVCKRIGVLGGKRNGCVWGGEGASHANMIRHLKDFAKIRVVFLSHWYAIQLFLVPLGCNSSFLDNCLE